LQGERRLGEHLALALDPAARALDLLLVLGNAERHAGACGLHRAEVNHAEDATGDSGAEDKHKRGEANADRAAAPQTGLSRAGPEGSQRPAAFAAHRHLMTAPRAIRR